ncbi:MAG: hypothetical protein K9J13_10795 [Saprospiraceae bacterium]|nr:hypothetical protein [Saprospiraceae bacterium]
MSIGIISEGITDQVVITNLIYGYFNNTDINVEPLQPKDKEPFGWTKVFKYCGTNDFKEAFIWYDYVIIQIDTDTHADWEYSNIPLVSSRDEKTIKNQIDRVVEIFVEIIGEDFYKENNDKIIFAISVETIECWILPFYTNRKAHAGKIGNCLQTLNREYINPKFGFTIDPKRKAYDNSRYYEIVTAPMKNNRELKKNQSLNPSLKIFVNNLQKIKK